MCKRLARVSVYMCSCEIIYIWISLLTTITCNVENKYETPSHVLSTAAAVTRWFPFVRRCACCMLTKVHSSHAVDEIISVSHRAGRGAEPMQTSLETPKRANTGAECPKLLTHLLIHESLCLSLPHDSEPLLLLFPHYFTSLLRAQISSPTIRAVASDHRSDSASCYRINCERERSDYYDTQIVEIFLTKELALTTFLFVASRL